MRELAQVVNSKQQKFGTLKLMFVHRNSDKLLAEALGATEGIKILYYHHSLSYKYQGPLRVQNILSSVYHLMSLSSKDIPLKYLTTPEDLKSFIESTNKALLVMEFCGWTSGLLAKTKKSATDNGFGIFCFRLSYMHLTIHRIKRYSYLEIMWSKLEYYRLSHQ